jgi:hypothetical protein
VWTSQDIPGKQESIPRRGCKQVVQFILGLITRLAGFGRFGCGYMDNGGGSGREGSVAVGHKLPTATAIDRHAEYQLLMIQGVGLSAGELKLGM